IEWTVNWPKGGHGADRDVPGTTERRGPGPVVEGPRRVSRPECADPWRGSDLRQLVLDCPVSRRAQRPWLGFPRALRRSRRLPERPGKELSRWSDRDLRLSARRLRSRGTDPRRGSYRVDAGAGR